MLTLINFSYINYFIASSTATATAAEAPTIGLLLHLLLHGQAGSCRKGKICGYIAQNSILVEGAQGTDLDINYGYKTLPYTN